MFNLHSILLIFILSNLIVVLNDNFNQSYSNRDLYLHNFLLRQKVHSLTQLKKLGYAVQILFSVWCRITEPYIFHDYLKQL